MIDRRDALMGGLALGVAGTVAAQTPPPGTVPHPAPSVPADPTETITLWSNGCPGGLPAVLPVETVVERSTDPMRSDRAIHGITQPRLMVFRPHRPNGAAALIMPGGSYRRVVLDKEGYETARWLADRGWTCFVLFYRLPGEGWAEGGRVVQQDGQRAMRLIRARAHEFGVDPSRIAAIGFSAGGHVCGMLATTFDADCYQPADAADGSSARPNAVGLIYAVQSMHLPVAHAESRMQLLGPAPDATMEAAFSPEVLATNATPPAFIVHAEDDPAVPVDNSLRTRSALKAKGVAVETHLFARGGHGFGIRGAAGLPAAAWPHLFADWAHSQGIA